MNKLFPLFLLIALAGSCSKDNYSIIQQLDKEDAIESTISLGQAQLEFTKILSKAVANTVELRSFLKDESLKQYDGDYDVFYPFVKDDYVCEGATFRDVLLKYTDEEMLNRIEKAAPKLTIMVPDFSWVSENCFSVRSCFEIIEKIC